MSSTAAPGYVRKVLPQGEVQPETYVFSEGRFFGGGLPDAGQARINFTDVLKLLVPSLAKQHYFPTRDTHSANLAIVVHWGATLAATDPLRNANPEAMNKALADYLADIAAQGYADPAPINYILSNEELGTAGQAAAINANAELLGYRRTLEKERRKLTLGTTDELVMSEELNEERYFVVLMAYDYQFMKKAHKPRLLWVTRLSIRSPGNSFRGSLSMLASAGSDVFGTQLDGLKHQRAGTRQATVRLPDMDVIGPVTDPTPRAGK